MRIIIDISEEIYNRAKGDYDTAEALAREIGCIHAHEVTEAIANSVIVSDMKDLSEEISSEEIAAMLARS